MLLVDMARGVVPKVFLLEAHSKLYTSSQQTIMPALMPPQDAPPATLPPPTGRPALPKTFTHTTPAPILHYQGAEALLYRTHFLLAPSENSTLPSLPAALKHRPAKPYRHPLLDAKLTRHRILSEARVLVKLRKEGIAVPAVYALDWEQGWMLSEWIEGGTIRGVLDRELDKFEASGGSGEEDQGGRRDTGLWGLMGRIGKVVARCHEVGVVHGDLTTSNLMLRPKQPENETGSIDDSLAGDVVMIDFGLSSQSVQEEDRAVDLYVLERAFGSTHPRTEDLFGEVLRSYGECYKAAKGVLKRFEEVRMRGRKKILIG